MRLAEAIAAIVEALVGRRLDYQALYPASVAAVAADNTVELLPDNPKVRGTGLAGIKIRHGFPGYQVTAQVGQRVLLGWEEGDPSKPFCMAWDPGNTTADVAFNGGTEKIARTGDSAGELYADMTGAVPGGVGPVIYYRSPRGTGAWAPIVALPAPPLPVTPGTAVTIDEGADHLLA